MLYEQLNEPSNLGISSVFKSTSPTPTIEWLLVADGRSDTQIRYLVGTTDDTFLDDLEAILRTALPKTYELTHVDWHPRLVEQHLSASDEAPQYAAGIEYRGHTPLRKDWLTSLTSFEEQTTSTPNDTSHRVPLSILLETLSDADVPVIYQLVCRPFGDQRADTELYRADLENGVVTTADKALNFVFPNETKESQDRSALATSYRDRLADLETRALQRTFCLSARAVALTRGAQQNADTVVRRLENEFAHLGGPFHEIRGHVYTDQDLHTGTLPPASRLFEDLIDRTCHEPTYEATENRLPWNTHESAGIVATPDELPGFCFIDGAGLTTHGQRALRTRQSERTGLSLPSSHHLERYAGEGQALCMPLTEDRQPYGEPFVLPPSLQDRHLFVVGDTGSGKSVLTIGALGSNVEATAGPEILFDYKGSTTAEEYLQTHYAQYGTLEDVLYFDLTKTLPALSVFDIRPLLDAGLSREEARSRIAGHYEEILAGLLGKEQYHGAPESTKAIRNHLRALYDPVHGTDAVSHAELFEALQQTLSDRTPPPTSDERLTAYFDGLLERDRDVFNKVLGGAVGRVERIATDDRLAPLFDYVPSRHTDDETETSNQVASENGDDASPQFDFIDVIDDDTVVIFDFGGMEEQVKRALTLVLLSNLWTALKARTEASPTTQQLPLVNLYLEEAKDVAATQLVDTLLSQGRSFGLSVMLGVQFPGQLESPDPSNHTYEEALNEIGTFVVGNVSIGDELAKALATDDLPPGKVARRLAAIRHGEWLIRPAAAFGSPPPRPFLGRSLPAPDGHPASETPLTRDQRTQFTTAFELAELETWNEAGLRSNYELTPADANGNTREGTSNPNPTATESRSLRVDSLLPHTTRLPDCVTYDEVMDALCCEACDNRYDPTIDGMRRTIECCHTLDDVDSDDIPVCELSLKLTPDEREASEWTDRQLLFLQAVYNAQQLRYDPLEYDLLHDSMIRLQEYVGIETDEITPLLEADLLRHDTDHPHRLYTVSSAGRTEIGESYRQGVDYGHGIGDLEESSQHVFGIEVTRRYLEKAYADDPDSPVCEVIPYYDLGDDDNHRLDLAGTDADGEIIVTAEVERINNDVHRAVPDDYDKMAACDPEEAIWVVMKQADGHKVLSALTDPLEGDPRVEKTYAKTTPPQQFRIDTPGMTAVYPAEWLLDRTEAGEFPSRSE
ncbi:ATP-binding protein [Natronorubrum aibiense]|nr:ATP-binding protein [Natronorubrum aibiense]